MSHTDDKPACWRRKKFWRNTAIIVLALLLLYAAIGFFLVPWIAHRQLESRLGEATGRTVTVERVRANPFLLTLSVEGFAVSGRDQAPSGTPPLAAFDRLFVDVSSSSLIHFAPVLEQLILDRPQAHVARDAEGELSFQDIVDRLQQRADPAEEENNEEPAALPRFRIGRFEINDGLVQLQDHGVSPAFEYQASPIQLVLLDFGTLDEDGNTVSLDASTPLGTEFTWDGRLQLDPFSSTGRIGLRGLAFQPFGPYFHRLIPLGPGRSRASLELPYTFNDVEGGELLAINDAHLLLEDIELIEPENEAPLLELETIEISGIHFRLSAQSARVQEVALRNGRMRVERNADGGFPVLELLANETGGSSPQSSPGSSPAASPWEAEVEQLRIEEVAVQYRDEAFAQPLETALQLERLLAGPLSTDLSQDIPLRINGSLADSGEWSVEGNLSAEPLSADLQIALRELDMSAFTAVAARFADLESLRGFVSLEGDTRLQMPEDVPEFAFDGRFLLRELSAAPDAESDPWIQLPSLRLEGIRLRGMPVAFAAEELNLDAPELLAERLEDGTLNWLALLSEEPADTRASETPAEGPEPLSAETEDTLGETPALQARIDSLTISDGTLVFRDRSVQPVLQQRISGIEGRISSFSLSGDEPVNLQLRALIQDLAEMEARAEWQPGAFDQRSIAELTLEGLRLPPLSPYSAQFVGRGMDQGQLNLSLDYSVENTLIEGSQTVRITDFQLGPPTGGSPLIDAPVGLAVSLLKDREGTINLTVPVSGDLNDPQFSFAEIIRNAFGNIIRNAATAPFRLIGSVFGGGGGESEERDLSFVAFEPGSAELSPAATEKLRILATALFERPELRFSLIGSVNEETDSAALARQQLRQRLHQEAAAGPDTESSASPDYEQLVATAYRERFTPGSTDTATNGLPQPASDRAPDDTPQDPEVETSAPAASPVLARLSKRRAAAVRPGDPQQATSHPSPPGSEISTSEPPPAGSVSAEEPDSSETLLVSFEEMEAALLGQVTVTDSELGELRSARIEAVRSFLLAERELDENRLTTSPSPDEAPAEAPAASVRFQAL